LKKLPHITCAIPRSLWRWPSLAVAAIERRPVDVNEFRLRVDGRISGVLSQPKPLAREVGEPEKLTGRDMLVAVY
jgi:hypothetical protein